MKDSESLLAEAQKFKPAKAQLEDYRDVITTLRKRGGSWREISKFLEEKGGIAVEHTKIARSAASWSLEKSFSNDLPRCVEYISALNNIALTQEERLMLLFHFNKANRTVTYSELSHAVNRDDFRHANLVYGALAKKLCEELAFKPFPSASGRPFFGSVIGMSYSYAGPKDELQLVMHHELSKALMEMELNGEEKNG